MGRRIMKAAAAVHRSTDFQKMDSLMYLSDQHGLRVMSFLQTTSGWVVDYLKPSIAREPKLEECRDAQDYDLRIDAWMRMCTVRSAHYESFEAMVLGEIDRLNKIPL